MTKLNLHKPKKYLSQNFLQDKNIARKIVNSISLKKNDNVVEIGPGKGILTSELLNNISHLTAVELDSDLTVVLNERFGNFITLLNEDFLKVSLEKLSSNKKIRLVGNIPYKITSPIIFHAIDSQNEIVDMTIMIQREVAKRIVASPNSKDYGILSVLVQYYCTPKLLFNVSPKCFIPQPKVISSVVHFDFEKRKYPITENDLLFRKIVRGTFNQRRKTLRNTLRTLGYSENILSNLSIDLNRRAESLSVQEFLSLTTELLTE